MSTDSATIKLGAISKGQRITISAFGMCGSTAKITLKDDGTSYAALEKTSQSIAPQLMGQKTAVYSGAANLRLEVNISHISYTMKIKPIVNHSTICDAFGKVKGSVYNIAIEENTDDDYNDYIITVVATNKCN